MRYRAKIRRHLRSARVSALTSEERQTELREAEQSGAQKRGRSEPATPDDTQGPGSTAHGSPS
jgi:hypothetical protein